jgi:hypothetical protein
MFLTALLNFPGHLQALVSRPPCRRELCEAVSLPTIFALALLTLNSMLFEFHQKQNAKKPNSIHATYLVTGTKRTTEHTNGTNGRHGEDVDMRRSPFMSSMPEPEEPAEEPVKETTILLVREEELQSV